MRELCKLFWMMVFAWLILGGLIALVTLSGCSTANQWKPRTAIAEAPRVPVCVQYGSKLYDRATGAECPDLHRHKRCSVAAARNGDCQ